jgi:hypothetical protein
MDIGADNVGIGVDRLVEHGHLIAREEVARREARSPDDDRLTGGDLDRIEPIDPVEQG